MRYAIYFTPAADSPLTRLAAGWLGRDAFTGGALPHPRGVGLQEEDFPGLVADPARYGFHATLKAPFVLRAGAAEAELEAALAGFARAEAGFPLQLAVREMDGFIAIVPAEESAKLQDFAGRVVTGFDRFRAELTEADIARRRPERLSEAQRDHLQRWGYPYVLDSFRFHMTLTGRVPAERRSRVLGAARAAFDAVLRQPIEVDAVALFVETEPGGPFVVRSLHPLRGTA